MRLNKVLIAAIAGTTALSACVQPGMYNDPNAQAKGGALMGAMAGAALGAASNNGGNTTDRMLGGAVIGGLLGGGVGAVLDRQSAELRQQIHTPGVQIINEGNRLRVVMPEGILFATNSASVNPAIYNDLNSVAMSLNRYPNSMVQVVGHTDNTGTAAYNMDLSQRRAGAVAGLLQSAGVAPSRIAAIGQGENQPVASNLTTAGKAQNRRVEIIIIPTA
jgi:outer membrane protein OmpA-like peptidoglycan-associated protein